MKKKHFYEKPSMQVVQLKQQPQLLAGSSTAEAQFENYQDGEFTWEDD